MIILNYYLVFCVIVWLMCCFTDFVVDKQKVRLNDAVSYAILSCIPLLNILILVLSTRYCIDSLRESDSSEEDND